MSKIIKYGFYAVFAAIFGFTIFKLFLVDFLPEKTDEYGVKHAELLRVAYPEEPLTIDPTDSETAVRQRTVNIYEPLVKLDKNFQMRPNLAISWGMLDELTWEFNLRPGVKFHDGSDFNSKDAAASIERAKSYEPSELKDMMASIKEISIVDDLTLKITTEKPDPLLLQRLSYVFMIPSEDSTKAVTEPVGTGPYKFSEWVQHEKMTFVANENYWGAKPKFKKVEMTPYVDKSGRVSDFLHGKSDFLAFVPFDGIEEVKKRDFEVVTVPSLEVQFLLFNLGKLSDVNLRRAISLAVDQKFFEMNAYVHGINQFVSPGVFGYNPKISSHRFDFEKATKILEENGLKGKTVTFHLYKGQEYLGEYLRKQLDAIGLNLVVSYLEGADMEESLKNGKGDIYFFGFRADLGDSNDFFNIVIRTGADFNAGGYSNPEVDALIDASSVEMNLEKRRDMLQNLMKVVVEDDVFGVPLLEYDIVMSFSNKFSYEPRLDGFIYFDDIIVK